MKRSCVVLAIALFAQTARAQPAPTQEEQARHHFVAGQTHYQEGRYKEALAEFELGYALSPRPEFLVNFAQVHRKLGEYDQAISEAERYLATGPPPHLADEARRLLAMIREERAQRTAQPRHPSEAPEPAPPAPKAAPAPIVLPRPAPPPKRHPRWIWGVVAGAVVVAAGAAVGIGLAVAYPQRTWPSELPREDFR